MIRIGIDLGGTNIAVGAVGRRHEITPAAASPPGRAPGAGCHRGQSQSRGGEALPPRRADGVIARA